VQLDNVKDVMIENIDRVLERGERIELLVDKTDRLNHQAFKFEKTVGYRLEVRVYSLHILHLRSSLPHQSRSLKNTLYYRKIRNIIMVVVIVAVSSISKYFEYLFIQKSSLIPILILSPSSDADSDYLHRRADMLIRLQELQFIVMHCRGYSLITGLTEKTVHGDHCQSII
jgi:hypothetical protein